MKTQIISFHCVLKNNLGQLISSSDNREVINHPQGNGETLVDLAGGLQNVRPGEKRQIKIRAERAYGFYNLDLVAELPRTDFKNGQTLKVGDNVRMTSLESGQVISFRVTHATKLTVTVDGNHPLAGQDLVFDIDVTDVRDINCDDESYSVQNAGGSLYH